MDKIIEKVVKEHCGTFQSGNCPNGCFKDIGYEEAVKILGSIEPHICQTNEDYCGDCHLVCKECKHRGMLTFLLCHNDYEGVPADIVICPKCHRIVRFPCITKNGAEI